MKQVAAGKGERFGDKKQFIDFLGKPIWKWSYDTAIKCLDEVIVVGVDIQGGETRQESVKIGLENISGKYVVIFDASRPLVTKEQIEQIVREVKKYPSVSFALTPTDTMYSSGIYQRAELNALQVPQAFNTAMLLEAHQETKLMDATDDTILFDEIHKMRPRIIEGGRNLYKLTTKEDLGILQSLHKDTIKVLITGGSGDLAKAIAKRFNNCLTPDKKELNITNYNNVKEYIKTHKPDILINCAGYIKPDSVKESDIEEWKKQIEVNLIGTYYCSREFLKYGNTIINISSAAGLKGKPNWSAYSAAKAGVINFTKVLADEGVDAYCISPHRIDTKMRHLLFPNEDKRTLMNPDKIADVIEDIIVGKYQKGINIEISINEIKIHN